MSKLFDSFPHELKETVFEFRAEQLKKGNKFKRLSKNKIQQYAYSGVHKLPLDTKRQVLSAINHFDNVKKISEDDKYAAFKKIIKAAETFGICTMGFREKYAKYQSEH